MTDDEYNEFLRQLALSSNKRKTANDFYQAMVIKYNNQFAQNGLFDELTEILHNLNADN